MLKNKIAHHNNAAVWLLKKLEEKQIQCFFGAVFFCIHCMIFM